MSEGLPIAKGSDLQLLLPAMANRHGLIAGATGTGKTVTLRVLAEHFSNIGVPVFMADVKGDLSGIARPGQENPKIKERLKQLGVDEFQFASFPTVFWDVYGQQGHPVRTTVSDMGPLLLSRLLNLNEIQSGVLQLVFKIADDNGLLLLDLKDLRAMLQHVGDSAAQFKTQYGNISAASIGAIQRGLVALDEQGGEKFFGEPALDLDDLLQTDSAGRGMVNILVADQLINAPMTYATFLLWLLSELFERLPEVGDPEKPKLVFFFDEAHLTVKAAAQTFRPNKKIDVEKVITELGVGEALVSFLDEKGQPNPVDRALIFPPQSQLPPLGGAEREQVIKQSTLYGHYEKIVDRESAYEMLKLRAPQAGADQTGSQGSASWQSEAGSLLEAAGKSAVRAMGTQLGREIVRGVLGSIFGSTSTRKKR
jgi:uncharacterized protein